MAFRELFIEKKFIRYLGVFIISGVNRAGSSDSKTNYIPRDSDDKEASVNAVAAEWLDQVVSEQSDTDEEMRDSDIEILNPGNSQDNSVVQFLSGQIDASEEVSSPTGPITRSQSRKGKDPVSEQPKRAGLTGKRLRAGDELTEYDISQKERRKDPSADVVNIEPDKWPNEEFFRSLLTLPLRQSNPKPQTEAPPKEIFYTSIIASKNKKGQVPSISTQVDVHLELPEDAGGNLRGLLKSFLSSFSIIETDDRIQEKLSILTRLESLEVSGLSENIQLEAICFKAWCLLEAGQYSDSKKILDDLSGKVNSSPFGLLVKGRLFERTHQKSAAVNFYNQSLALVRERQALPKDTFKRGECILHIEELERLLQNCLHKTGPNADSSWKIPANEGALQAHLQTLALFIDGSSIKKPGNTDKALRICEKTIEKHPGCATAKELYVELLMREKPDDATSISVCLDFLQSLMRQKPKKIRPKLDYMSLLHKVQLARFHVGTHREGSLRADVKVLGHQVLRLSPGNVEALRLLSVQYRFDGDFQTADAMINGSFISLLSGVINLVSISSDEVAKKIKKTLDAIPNVLNEDLGKYFENSLVSAGFRLDDLEDFVKQKMFIFANILYLIKKGEETDLLMQFLESLFFPLLDSQKVNLSRWIAFVLSDKAFVGLKELEGRLKAQKEGILPGNSNFEKEREDVARLFNTSLKIFPKHPAAHFGLGALCECFGDADGELEHTLKSYKIQPTYAVFRRLKKLGKMDLVKSVEVDEKPEELVESFEQWNLESEESDKSGSA